MKYYIITALGPFKKFYSITQQNPLHGTFQGSGISGSNWLFNSVLMMNTLKLQEFSKIIF